MKSNINQQLLVRNRHVWHVYDKGYWALPMYSNVPEKGVIEVAGAGAGYVMNLGMYHGVLAYLVLEKMLEICMSTPEYSNLGRHNTSWWANAVKEIVPTHVPCDPNISKGWVDLIPRNYWVIAHYDNEHVTAAISSIIGWDELFYSMCKSKKLSKKFMGYILKEHVKVMIMINDQSKLDKTHFNFVVGVNQEECFRRSLNLLDTNGATLMKSLSNKVLIQQK